MVLCKLKCSVDRSVCHVHICGRCNLVPPQANDVRLCVDNGISRVF